MNSNIHHSYNIKNSQRIFGPRSPIPILHRETRLQPNKLLHATLNLLRAKHRPPVFYYPERVARMDSRKPEAGLRINRAIHFMIGGRRGRVPSILHPPSAHSSGLGANSIHGFITVQITTIYLWTTSVGPLFPRVRPRQ